LTATLEVRINDSVAAGCAGFSVGLAGTENVIAGLSLTLVRDMQWQRRKPQLIGSDRGSHV
jgi:hypothetical protein